LIGLLWAFGLCSLGVWGVWGVWAVWGRVAVVVAVVAVDAVDDPFVLREFQRWRGGWHFGGAGARCN